MSRGRHRVVPVRRPIARPVVGVAVAATMLAGPLLLAAGPAVTSAPTVAAPPAPAGASPAAVDLDVLAARDEASASRGQSRPVASAPEPVAAEPVAPEPVAPEASVPPPPVAEPAPPVVVGRLWVTTDVNVRSGPSADTDRVGSLPSLVQVEVTAAATDGWRQVVVDGVPGWVNGAYLSETEPGPETAGVSDAPCSINPGIEPNLSSNARAVYRAVCAAYGGSVSGFGGYRPGDDGDHGSGRAVDVMVSGAAGWEIARFLQARAGELGITYLIYEQKYWSAGSPAGAWEQMEDRGGATANHYDHVHVSVR